MNQKFPRIALCALFLSVALLFSFSLYAQVSVNPDDDFYIEAQNWELKGLTGPLPQLRPYPVSVIRRILTDVMASNDKRAAEYAEKEYERIFSKPYKIFAEAGGVKKISDDRAASGNETSADNLWGEFGIAGDVTFSPLVSLGFDLGMYAETEEYDAYSAMYVNKTQDSIYDASEMGGADMYLDWNMNATVGSESVYVTGGVSKAGFGPFIGEGLAINDTSYHSANLMLNVVNPKWSYSMLYATIGATENNPTGSFDVSDGKYLTFHSIKYSFNRKISVAYYENIIFGPRANIAYLFPAPYMPMQNITGANDNLQMGLLFEVKPLSGFLWATDIFVDDLDVDEIVKLNFDAKIRIAAQTGLVYATPNSLCSRLSLDYTIIMPYTGAHWEYDDDDDGTISGSSWNYQNYLNSGVNIGTVLDPNSDRLRFSTTFRPFKNLKFNLTTSIIRHANGAEDFDSDDAAKYVLASSGQYATDGSVNMHQMFSGDSSGKSGTHVSAAWEKLGFMTSDHIMLISRWQLEGEYTFARTKRGALSVKLGYMFEYINNNGVDRDVYSGLGYSYDEDAEVYHFNGSDYTSYDDMYEAAKTVAKQQKASWVAGLTDKVNHYFSLALRYTY